MADRLLPTPDDVARRWHALPVGGSITLKWSPTRALAGPAAILDDLGARRDA